MFNAVDRLPGQSSGVCSKQGGMLAGNANTARI
jgi:hypothetical protein